MECCAGTRDFRDLRAPRSRQEILEASTGKPLGTARPALWVLFGVSKVAGLWTPRVRGHGELLEVLEGPRLEKTAEAPGKRFPATSVAFGGTGEADR